MKYSELKEVTRRLLFDRLIYGVSIHHSSSLDKKIRRIDPMSPEAWRLIKRLEMEDEFRQLADPKSSAYPQTPEKSRDGSSGQS